MLVVMWPLLVDARADFNAQRSAEQTHIEELPIIDDVKALILLFQPLDSLTQLVGCCCCTLLKHSYFYRPAAETRRFLMKLI